MIFNLIGPFIRNFPFGTEIAFSKGLKRRGHVVNELDPEKGGVFDPEADATIVFKHVDKEVGLNLKTASGIKIVYQPDDLRFPHIQKMMLEMLEYCDAAFTFDDDGAETAMSFGYTRAQKLLLTADDKLYRRLNLPKTIDVCFIGSLTGGPNHKSRQRMVEIVKGIPGVKSVIGSDLYDTQKIVQLYNMSKIVLNHATDVGQPFGHGYGLQCRHFEAGMTGAYILSNEIIRDDSGLVNFCRFSSERELEQRTRWMLRPESADAREKIASNLFDEICQKHMPEHRADEIVKFVESMR